MSYESDMQYVIKRATEQGWRHRRTEKNHHQFYAPNGTDIVTASSTPGASSQWQNFMADMRRAGYTNGVGTLGDAMPEGMRALAKQQTDSNARSVLSVKQLTVDVLGRHSEGMSTADINAYVKSVRPGMSDNATNTALSRLVEQGRIIRVSPGFYRLSAGDAVPVKKPAPPPLAAASVPTHIAGQPSGDPQIDQDLAALDAALVALASIEGVVRRNREVLHQLANLKKLLGRMGE